MLVLWGLLVVLPEIAWGIGWKMAGDEILAEKIPYMIGYFLAFTTLLFIASLVDNDHQPKKHINWIDRIILGLEEYRFKQTFRKAFDIEIDFAKFVFLNEYEKENVTSCKCGNKHKILLWSKVWGIYLIVPRCNQHHHWRPVHKQVFTQLASLARDLKGLYLLKYVTPEVGEEREQTKLSFYELLEIAKRINIVNYSTIDEFVQNKRTIEELYDLLPA